MSREDSVPSVWWGDGGGGNRAFSPLLQAPPPEPRLSGLGLACGEHGGAGGQLLLPPPAAT